MSVYVNEYAQEKERKEGCDEKWGEGGEGVPFSQQMKTVMKG